jgi:hypothetical protein
MTYKWKTNVCKSAKYKEEKTKGTFEDWGLKIQLILAEIITFFVV